MLCPRRCILLLPIMLSYCASGKYFNKLEGYSQSFQPASISSCFMFVSFGTVYSKLRLATRVLVQNIFEYSMIKQLRSQCCMQPDAVTFDLAWDNTQLPRLCNPTSRIRLDCCGYHCFFKWDVSCLSWQWVFVWTPSVFSIAQELDHLWISYSPATAVYVLNAIMFCGFCWNCCWIIKSNERNIGWFMVCSLPQGLSILLQYPQTHPQRGGEACE